MREAPSIPARGAARPHSEATPTCPDRVGAGTPLQRARGGCGGRAAPGPAPSSSRWPCTADRRSGWPGPPSRRRDVLPGVGARRVPGAVQAEEDQVLGGRCRRDGAETRLAVEVRGDVRERRAELGAVLRLVVLPEAHPALAGIARPAGLIVLWTRTAPRVGPGERQVLEHDGRLHSAVAAAAGLVAEADDHGWIPRAARSCTACTVRSLSRQSKLVLDAAGSCPRWRCRRSSPWGWYRCSWGGRR